MSRTYKATGINLKTMPLGESDRILTILTREFGLIRVVAMGARKHNSKLGGRSGLFVVNELLLAKGRSLDKLTQAETLESYPKLGQDLKKLTASQYLAELCLCQALSEQPQEELFYLFNEHLKRLERSPTSDVLAHLTHAVFQLLVLAGIAPQVHLCCVTHQPLSPSSQTSDQQFGFSAPAGGAVTLAALETLLAKQPARPDQSLKEGTRPTLGRVAESRTPYPAMHSPAGLHARLTATQLSILQHLAQAELPQPDVLSLPVGASHTLVEQGWVGVEQALRQYAQYHFDRPIRSATLIDACFQPLTPTPNSQRYDTTV